MGAVLLLVTACGDAVIGQGVPVSTTCTRQPPLDYENTGDGLIGRHCRSCHSTYVREALRAGAPAGVNFDNEQDILDWADLIFEEAIEFATMPPAGGMIPEERDQLEEYLRCNVFPSVGRASVNEDEPEETEQ